MVDDDEIFAALADIDVEKVLSDTTNLVSEVLADMSDIDEVLSEIDAENILQDIG